MLCSIVSARLVESLQLKFVFFGIFVTLGANYGQFSGLFLILGLCVLQGQSDGVQFGLELKSRVSNEKSATQCDAHLSDVGVNGCRVVGLKGGIGVIELVVIRRSIV